MLRLPRLQNQGNSDQHQRQVEQRLHEPRVKRQAHVGPRLDRLAAQAGDQLVRRRDSAARSRRPESCSNVTTLATKHSSGLSHGVSAGENNTGLPAERNAAELRTDSAGCSHAAKQVAGRMFADSAAR